MNKADNVKVRSKIRAVALSLLARREYLAVELKNKLSKRFMDADSSLIEKVVYDLTTENLQSDIKYIQSYIRFRAYKGYGPYRIKQELRAKGAELEELIEILKELFHEESAHWQQALIKAYRKKYISHSASIVVSAMYEQEKLKATKYLYLKGL